jgi:glycosyltransferase involved in cell wall biosynthesis
MTDRQGRPLRIAICAALVPFVRGGNEELVDGLAAALRQRGHFVELVGLPFKWYPRQALVASVLAWRLLDITESNGLPIDLAICTKFPSYVVRHPNKVTWLVHQYRQAYDWFGTPLSDLDGAPENMELRRWIAALDRKTIGESKAIYAISRNVAARLKRFNGLAAEPLYVPVRDAKFRAGPYGDYLLFLSRLDGAKRPELLLRALAHLPADRRPPAVIAGAGPAEADLHRLAAQLGLGDGVRFAGRVSDDEAVELYANARAVFFAPVDEDYGLVTIEAFQSSRPVITTDDAGGVLEFVEDGVTGLVTKPDIGAVAGSIARLHADAAFAARLGGAGCRRVADIRWDRVVDALLAKA